MIDVAEKTVFKPILFKKYMISILTALYENLPTPILFDTNKIEELSGYEFKVKGTEIKDGILIFLETLQYLKRDELIDYKHNIVTYADPKCPTIHMPDIPFSISKEGIALIDGMGLCSDFI